MSVVSHRHRFIFVRPRKVAGTSIQVALSRCLGAEDINGFDDGFDEARAFDPRTDEDDFGVLGGAPEMARQGTNRHNSMRDHELPDSMRDKVGERVWDEYFKFTVVRNPWDLLVSFLYSKFGPMYWKGVWWPKDGPIAFAYNLPRLLRLHHLRSELRRGRLKESVESVLREGLFYNIREIPLFYFSRQEPYADAVIRYETLQHDFDNVCRRLKLPPQRLPRTNTKPRPRDTDYHEYFTDYSREYIADLCSAMTSMFGYRFEDDGSVRGVWQRPSAPIHQPAER